MSDRIKSLHDYQHVRETLRLECPEQFNFGFDVVDRWAEQRPDADAIFWVGPESLTRRITFAQVAHRSDQVAFGLSKLGLSRGDRVLVMLPRVAEWWETLLGIFKAGMVASPGTSLLTAGDIAYRVKAAEVSAIVTDVAGASKVDQVADELPSLKAKILVSENAKSGWHPYEEWASETAEGRQVKTRSDDPALIYFTSGTTGPPKMVLHTHASYAVGHQVTGRYWLDLTTDDLHWNISDTGWAKAAWSSLFGPWICGACLFVQHNEGKFQPLEVLRYLNEYPITTMCAAPTIFRMLVQQDLSDLNPVALRDCVAAGEPLNPEVISIWREATGITVRDGYGQTETVILCGNFPGVEVKPGSMGLPAPGIDLTVIDENGEALPVGEEGDLAVRVQPDRPVGLFKEYYKNPEATAHTFRGDWYVTGDRGKTDEDGYFWFVARADDVITSSAYRIGPFEVESALLEHPAVAEAAVVGKPDATRGEIVKAFVVLAARFTGSDELVSELQQHVKATTAPYKYPREITFVPELPKTISGKIRRVDLRDQASSEN